VSAKSDTPQRVPGGIVKGKCRKEAKTLEWRGKGLHPLRPESRLPRKKKKSRVDRLNAGSTFRKGRNLKIGMGRERGKTRCSWLRCGGGVQETPAKENC